MGSVMTDLKKIAIYARYSSDQQKISSIDDQISLCLSKLEATFKFSDEPMIFSDAAYSGSFMDRPGLQSLLKAASRKEFDVLVMEGLDRLTRSHADAAKLRDIFQYYGITIWTDSEGVITDLHIAFKGAMNKLYLTDMKAKVRRAHRGRVLSGYVPAGLSYGYKVVRGKVDAQNRNINGIREIVPEQAKIIKKIYNDFIAGMPIRQITQSLNNEGILSPRGGIWRDNSILGSSTKQEGILRKEIYRGYLIYNRSHKKINPVTGKMETITNPRSEWIISEVSHLRIIDDDTWNKAQSMINNRVKHRQKMKRKIIHKSHRPLTYIVKCGWCGGNKNLANKSRYVCSTYRFKNKACSNARGTKEEAILEKLAEALKERASNEIYWMKLFDSFWKSELEKKDLYQKEKKAIDDKISRFETAIEYGVNLNSTISKLKALQIKSSDINKKLSIVKIQKPMSNEEIKKHLFCIISLIEKNFTNSRYMFKIQCLLKIIVDKIILTPIPESPVGETVDVLLTNNWVMFYLQAQDIWNIKEQSKG